MTYRELEWMDPVFNGIKQYSSPHKVDKYTFCRLSQFGLDTVKAVEYEMWSPTDPLLENGTRLFGWSFCSRDFTVNIRIALSIDIFFTWPCVSCQNLAWKWVRSILNKQQWTWKDAWTDTAQLIYIDIISWCVHDGWLHIEEGTPFISHSTSDSSILCL